MPKPDPTPPLPWQPLYTLSPAMVRALMEVEAARAVVEHTPIPPGELLRDWVGEGWLEVAEPSRRGRLHVIGGLSTIHRQFNGRVGSLE